MARLTDEQREHIIADFHTGVYSNNELAKKYNTSHTTINKIVKGLEAKNASIVSSQISAQTHLSTQSFKEVSAVETAVNDRTKHLIYFQDSALENQLRGNELLKSATEMKDVLAHSTLTGKNKETVLGKDVPMKIEDSSDIIEVEIE